MSGSRASAHATPVDLSRVRETGDEALRARLHPAYAAGLRRLPAGLQVFRGLPFALARAASRRRWLTVDRPTTIELAEHGAVSHVVIAQFCDAWRDPETGRPADLPVGWVTPVGQPLARYTLEIVGGRRVRRIVRRRFEVNEGVIGWGQGAFAALPHRMDEPLDWQGPAPAPAPVRYAPAGQAGLLATMPGSWGPAQTGVADSVPSPTDELVLWLHEIALPNGPAVVRRLLLEPLGSAAEGGTLVVAAITTFRGTASPLGLAPRRSLRIERLPDAGASRPADEPTPATSVDLGQVIRTRPAPVPHAGDDWAAGSIPGWGSPRDPARPATAWIVDLAIAADATVAVDGTVVEAGQLPAEGRARQFGALRIDSLRTPTRRVEVEVIDAGTGVPMPARVHVHAADGRYLPPLGHRDEINPGLNEDEGADVVIGGVPYAYVPGRFPIELPAGRVFVEAARGFGYRPVRVEVDAASLSGPLRLPLEPVAGPTGAGWTAADCHVHFIAPTSALLQARAEGIAIVNLLATQWGDHHTSIADLPSAVVADDAGEHLVVMGSENRQNMLGHIGLLGASSAVLPMASAGGPEARLGDPLGWLMADWADAARAQRGLSLAVHFPLPYAEVAADIVTGRIDAVEMQALTPGVDGPAIREWYRFLNCGYRLPIVGGTDKMSAEIPLGAIRTYARLDPDRVLDFAAWADAVRAGRTFVSSGPFVELSVDGCEPGETVRLGARGGSVDVRAVASAALPIIERLELIHDGRVVAASGGSAGTDHLTLSERVAVATGGWLAVRATSREQVHSAFATAMGAHSSPVYLDVAGRPPFAPADAEAIGTIIDGAIGWVREIATIRSPADRRRFVRYLRDARATLDQRVREHT